MKKLLVLLAACGGSSPRTVPVAEPAPIANTPAAPDTSPPPTDLADRMHAFVILPSEMHWEANPAAISDDIQFEKYRQGTAFDVTSGPAVVVRGDVRNEKNEPVIAWNQKAHRLMCAKGDECLIAGTRTPTHTARSIRSRSTRAICNGSSSIRRARTLSRRSGATARPGRTVS